MVRNDANREGTSVVYIFEAVGTVDHSFTLSRAPPTGEAVGWNLNNGCLRPSAKCGRLMKKMRTLFTSDSNPGPW